MFDAREAVKREKNNRRHGNETRTRTRLGPTAESIASKGPSKGPPRFANTTTTTTTTTTTNAATSRVELHLADDSFGWLRWCRRWWTTPIRMTSRWEASAGGGIGSYFGRLISTSDIHIPDLELRRHPRTLRFSTLGTDSRQPVFSWLSAATGVLGVGQVRDLWPCYGVSLIRRTSPLRWKCLPSFHFISFQKKTNAPPSLLSV